MEGARKGGIGRLTRAFAVEWAKRNVIASAFLRTPLIERLWTDGTISPVVLLASDAASFVTGHTMVVNGGWLAV